MFPLNFKTLQLSNGPNLAVGQPEVVWGPLSRLSQYKLESHWCTHPTGVLAFKDSGALGIRTPGGSYLFAPGSMIYLPPQIPYEEAVAGAHSGGWYITVPAEAAKQLPQTPSVIKSTKVFRVLCEEVISWDPSRARTAKENKIIELVIENLLSAGPCNELHLTFPKTQKLMEVARKIMESPRDSSNLAYWANFAAMSTRSFTRHFANETGLSFVVWRQKARLMVAINMLSAGVPVAEVSDSLGYRHTSTFIAIFRRNLGCSPLQYKKAFAQRI